MSQRFWIWRQPEGEDFPTNLPDTNGLLRRLYQQAAPDDTSFPALARSLMALFPDADAPEAALAGGSSVWAEGPLDGKPPGAVYKLAVVWDCADRVRPAILAEASKLGLSVMDELKGEAHFANRSMLSLEHLLARLKEAEQAYREGKHAHAFAIYQPLARDGVASAQFHFGILHEFGHGTARDIDAAVSWYARAAQRGSNEAHHRLGVLYRSGTKIQRNDAAALEHLTCAAERRHTEAQRFLAMMYANGEGVAKDPARAAHWYAQAAADEDASAQLSLGLAYKNGEGVERDLATAKRWIRRSAAHGYRGAFFAMGTLYLTGQGVATEPVLAHALHRFASTGDPAMRAGAEQLSPDASLSAAALAQARDLLRALNLAANALAHVEERYGRLDR